MIPILTIPDQFTVQIVEVSAGRRHAALERIDSYRPAVSWLEPVLAVRPILLGAMRQPFE
jgi:hypothetical protein